MTMISHGALSLHDVFRNLYMLTAYQSPCIFTLVMFPTDTTLVLV